MKHKKYICYLIVVWAVLIFPFAGMAFWPSNETTENTELASWPELKTEEGWNKEYMSQMGAYFEDHFALRQYWVTANALLRSTLFYTSATDQVVLGSEDWLYYSGTLDDYLGKNLFSEREKFALLHNLKLIQEYVEGQGSQFILMVPPNKNSLYDEHMPSHYQKADVSNLWELTEALKEEEIGYVDLLEEFSKTEETLYFQRDSHWNSKGALLAYCTLMEQTGRNFETYRNVPYDLKKEHSGDLDEMLFPKAVQMEEDFVYDYGWNYRYINEVKDNMDSWIETVNPQKDGTILMYRDSFGESLLPFVAEAYGRAYFSRLVPYNLLQIGQYGPDTVVIEKVERNLDDFIQQAPIMTYPQRENISAPEAKTDTTILAEKSGSFLEVQGILDEDYLDTKTEIYVSVRNEATMETKTYEAFYTSTEEGGGFQLYLSGGSLWEGELRLSVIAVNGGQAFLTGSTNITWEI
ncbi:hypothetical protein H9X85_04965 [Anaerotignum lactatifermentans]|uniref:AlgX/AlgJ SGNH hydrolase-like domain-containing protein n=1 Tax=Anaerotignum lactatifermentans TaxID=160404 RepID=A0ABS2G6C8_9FIRM|nr:hypothetical protein [Anaerotignum lactatifermentans]MBM6828823.1 hypothetical protein [Anaerotignum lactatifermentans]MBM6877004.1 hypothetical protein [Anaerotignum lactatifermentans]MBM6950562.1 hypothetical protein [Anaerotignum lactatifermentans]